MGDRPPHPGKTPAQRRVLDEIGCGNFSPVAAKATIKALLDAGLIFEMSPARVPFLGAICMEVRRFEMPIAVHIWWCDAVAFTDEEMAAFEAEMDAARATLSHMGEK
jgi:hypothetical protein